MDKNLNSVEVKQQRAEGSVGEKPLQDGWWVKPVCERRIH